MFLTTVVTGRLFLPPEPAKEAVQVRMRAAAVANLGREEMQMDFMDVPFRKFPERSNYGLQDHSCSRQAHLHFSGCIQLKTDLHGWRTPRLMSKLICDSRGRQWNSANASIRGGSGNEKPGRSRAGQQRLQEGLGHGDNLRRSRCRCRGWKGFCRYGVRREVRATCEAMDEVIGRPGT